MEEQRSLLSFKIFKPKHPISIEPMLLIFSAGAMMSETLFQNFLLFQSCAKFNWEKFVCETELESEKVASEISMFRSSTSFFFWITTTSFIGSLIDYNLKYLRWFLFLPAIGQLMCDLLYFLNVLFFHWPSLALTMSTLFISGFTGQQIAAMSLTTTYISHNSTVANRSVRIGYVICSQVLGMGLGNLCGGYVLQFFGYGYGFLICILIQSVSIFVGLFLVEDLSKREFYVEKTHALTFMDAVKDGVQVVMKERPYHGRTFIISLLIICTIAQCYQIGEITTLYLYLRNQFGWEASQFGLFMFYILTMRASGTVIANEFLKRRLRFRDATVGLVASLFEILSHSMWVVTAYQWQIYLIPIFGILERVIQLISISLATKCVASEEYGRLSSLFALTNLSTPVATLLYNFVYQYTLSSCPTAIFLLSTAFCIPLPFIFWRLLIFARQTPPDVILRSGEDNQLN